MSTDKNIASRGTRKARPTRQGAGNKVALEDRVAAQPAATVKPYERTPVEVAAASKLQARAKTEPPSPKFKVSYENGRLSLDPDHPDPMTGCVLLLDAMGTEDIVLAEGLLNQIMNAARTGKELTSRDVNTMLATMHAIAPRDSTEALLATQMAAIHGAAMVAARKLNHVETIPQQDSASNLLNMLARTFAAQLEALKRYRSSGEQKVTVHHQHVNVSANQAVVGVTQGGGGANESGSQSHALGKNAASSPSDARSAALLGHQQAVGLPLSSASGEGPEGVPYARRQSRGA